MGPKNISLLSDSPAKDMSVMDRMCLKLEALCLEADKNPSLFFQEATKYVENQVTTVGSNMRKICAEIMRDLLPPSNTPDATDEDICPGDKTAKALEKEVLQNKQVHQEVTIQQPLVEYEGNNKIILTLNEEAKKGPGTGVKKVKLSDMEIREPFSVPEPGNSIPEALEKETVKLNLPKKCLDDLSSRPEKLDKSVMSWCEESSGSLTLKGQPSLPKIQEDSEQCAMWYVGSEYREALMQRICESASLGNIEEQKVRREFDESDLDWELL